MTKTTNPTKATLLALLLALPFAATAKDHHRSVGPTTTAPRLMKAVDPEYHWRAREAGIEGTVWIECLIDEDGRVFGPGVIASTHRWLESAVLEAVREWRFEPAQHLGKPTYAVVQIPFEFKLGTVKGTAPMKEGHVRIVMVKR
jgi:TonB family protein